MRAVGSGGGKQFKKLVFEVEGEKKTFIFPFFFGILNQLASFLEDSNLINPCY